MAPILFYINGAPADSRVRWPSVTLQDVLGAQPNTGSLTFDTVAPSAGDAIAIGLGSVAPADLLFGGEIQHLADTYQSDARNPALHEWPAELIDHTFALNKRRPFFAYSVSATTVAQHLVAVWAPGFTTVHVQTGLPFLNINFDGTQTVLECLNAVAQQIGGRVKVDYSRDVHLFIPPEPGLVMPDAITNGNPPLNTPPLVFTTDLSQVRTRVYGKGHGEKIPADVLAGDPILPVDATAFFNPAGGRAVASVTSDGGQTTQLTYTGIQPGGGGTLVGPGAAPSVAPIATGASSTGLSVPATYQYAYTHVTATGESLPSPLATVATGALADPTDPSAAPVTNAPINGGNINPGVHKYAVTFGNGAGETLPGPTNQVNITALADPTAIPTIVNSSSPTPPGYLPQTGQSYRYRFTFANDGAGTSQTGPSPISNSVASNNTRMFCNTPPQTGGAFRIWYVSIDGGAFFHIDAGAGANESHASGGPGTSDVCFGPFNNLGVTCPTANTTLQQTEPLTGIPTGPPGTTKRTIYRTAAGASQLKFLTTINDHVTTNYNDAAADAALGANAPATNTTAVNSFTITGVATGPAAVTARRIYRTVGNGSQLKFAGQILNNTATIYGLENTPDVSLGGNAPTADLSGLTQPTGQVNPGATSVPTAAATPFVATGGWAQVGQQTIRYTGITGNTLTGVPATGPGAILTTIVYGNQITPAPALTGVSGITRDIQNGSAVHVFVQRDDVAAQLALAQLEKNPDGSNTDGVREYVIVDERRGESGMLELCAADLANFAKPIVEVRYACRDPKTRAGSTVGIAFADGAYSPEAFNPAAFNTGHITYGYAGSFLIQAVTVTFDPAPQLLPRYTVTATSTSFNFVDLLQRVLITG